MKNIINYSSPEYQVKKLINQNMIISNTEYAKQKLSIYGYSNMIKSYREPYTFTDDFGNKCYRDNITFEQIESLFLFDKQLRNSVMAAMLDLEEHIKEVAADVIAKAFGTNPDDYLDLRNYRDRRKTDKRFSLSYTIKTLKDSLKSQNDPIRHYAVKYNTVPPWILFKSIYFSKIITFISKFKPAEQSAVASQLYDYSSHNLTIEQCRKLMLDTLYICLNYRNTAAHGGRIYLLSTKAQLRSNEIFGRDNVGGKGFGQLLFLLRMLKYQGPYNQLQNALNKELTRHCALYPNDSTYLAQALNINISTERYVYVSENSNIYHSNPHCSGMTKCVKTNFDSALDSRFVPCKRCIRFKK